MAGPVPLLDAPAPAPSSPAPSHGASPLDREHLGVGLVASGLGQCSCLFLQHTQNSRAQSSTHLSLWLSEPLMEPGRACRARPVSHPGIRCPPRLAQPLYSPPSVPGPPPSAPPSLPTGLASRAGLTPPPANPPGHPDHRRRSLGPHCPPPPPPLGAHQRCLVQVSVPSPVMLRLILVEWTSE